METVYAGLPAVIFWLSLGILGKLFSVTLNFKEVCSVKKCLNNWSQTENQE